ncbi:MAG TPA: hypothetical protein VKZ91_05480, partial [Woeseiaceae bacterium]|nr:hypothetical protein [Woeseiaceae bacterium]
MSRIDAAAAALNRAIILVPRRHEGALVIGTPLVSRRGVLKSMVCCGLLSSCGSPWADAVGSINERMSGDFAPVHDPCIIKAEGRYHV